MFFRRTPPSLRAFVDQYALERGLAVGSLRALGYVVTSFEKHLGRESSLRDFERNAVNAWLASLLRAGLDTETVRTRRTAMLGLWRHAHEAGLLRHGPARIIKIKVPDKPPTCWGREELARLLAVVYSLAGFMHGDCNLARRDFWLAYVLVDYDLGIRLGDLRRLSFDAIGADGTVVLVQGKTRRSLVGQLSAESLAAVEKLRGRGRRLVFGELVNHANAQRYMRKIVKAAGLRGSTKWIRRTGATWVEIHSPGSAPAYLGHSDNRTAYRSYVDPRHVQRHKPRPPKLEH